MRMLCFTLLASVASLLFNAEARADNAPEAKVLNLPEKYDTFVMAASGKLMIFHHRAAGKLSFLDVEKQEFTRELDKIPADALIAAGDKKLLLVIPGQKMVQRYDLATLKREKVAVLAGAGAPRTALMGCNGDGPLLVAGAGAQLLDIQTLKPIKIKGKIIGGSGRYGYRLRCSANGKTFGGIPTGYGPVGYSMMRVEGNRTVIRSFSSTSNAVRWAEPSADGHLFLLPGGGIYGPTGNRISANWLSKSTVFATVDPRYIISVRFAGKTGGGSTTHIGICPTADRRIVYTIVGMNEMAPHGNTNSRSSIANRLHYGETRYHYIPSAKALITLPYDNKHVYVRTFDLHKTLKNAGIDYLYVDSVPPYRVVRGDRLTYKMHAQSRSRRVRYELTDGPDGMSVNAKGQLRWDVPKNFDADTVTVITRVAAGEEEAFHSFDLAIEKAPAPMKATGKAKKNKQK